MCAEPSALAAAHLNGSTDVRSIVAVCFTPDLSETTVISPCGACRERIWYHAPNARVILPGWPQPTAAPIGDLFLHGELFPLWTPPTHSA